MAFAPPPLFPFWHKTKTIIARAVYLISQGIPADRIQILSFTRKSASEIYEQCGMDGVSVVGKAEQFLDGYKNILNRVK